MKQKEVSILGHTYVLGCPEGGERPLMDAVAAVDREMSAIRDGGKIKSRERIAVLAALNLAFTLAERAAARPAQAPVAMGEFDVDALIRRVDEALGSDGQLL